MPFEGETGGAILKSNFPYPTNLSRGCLRRLIGFYPPFSYPSTGYLDAKMSGVFPDVLEIVAEKENFCYKNVFNYDVEGRRLPNGSYSGMYGFLQSQLGDLTTIPMDMTITECCDETFPMFNQEVTIFFKRPVPGPDLAGFVKPFTGLTWALLFAIMVFVAILLFLLQGQARSSRDSGLSGSSSSFRKLTPEKPLKTFSFVELVLWSFGTFSQQSVSFVPRGAKQKFLVVMWLLVTILLGSTYKSALKASLISPVIHLPFNTWEEYLEKSPLPLRVALDGPVHRVVASADRNSLLGRLNKKTTPFVANSTTKGDFVFRGVAVGGGSEYYFIQLIAKEFSLNQATARIRHH